MKPGEALMEELEEIMNKHGITHWLFAFRDPDDLMDRFNSSGSLFWIKGASHFLSDQAEKEWKDLLEAEG